MARHDNWWHPMDQTTLSLPRHDHVMSCVTISGHYPVMTMSCHAWEVHKNVLLSTPPDSDDLMTCHYSNCQDAARGVDGWGDERMIQLKNLIKIAISRATWRAMSDLGLIWGFIRSAFRTFWLGELNYFLSRGVTKSKSVNTLGPTPTLLR